MRVLVAVVLASFAIGSVGAQPRSHDELVARGRVSQVHSARLFTMQGDVAGESEVLVVPPRPVSVSLVGSGVELRGALRRFSGTEVGAAWKDIDEQTRRAFEGRRVIVATSLIATTPGQPGLTEEQAPPPVQSAGAETGQSYALPVGQPTLHVIPATLVDFINDFAGQRVAVSPARVVGVLQPGAFLIEPATRYQKTMDYRDRILVLVDTAQLTVSPESIVSATVSVEGIARTLPDLRLKAGAAWPATLTPDAIDRLEVRAAILAQSVRTPDGTELTGRRVASNR